jgi:hypothetical protein
MQQPTDEPAWGSVRKVRFKSQIYGLIKYAAENSGRELSRSDIRKITEEDRGKREYVRLLISQTGQRRALRTMGDKWAKTYEKSVEDTIAFSKGIGVFDLEDNIVICPPRIKCLYGQFEESPDRVETETLRMLLESKYKAYMRFLVRLQGLEGDFYIPPEFRRRTKESQLSHHLSKNGFRTDIASFYTLRDLFYEFRLLNWRIRQENGEEHIYLTCQVAPEKVTMKPRYNHSIALNDFTIYFDKSVTGDEFQETLSKHYSDISGGYWGSIVNLLELRDRVSEQLRISDQQFNDTIVNLWKERTGAISIELSQGVVPYKKWSGLLMKGLSAPMIGDGIYATYIRISWR